MRYALPNNQKRGFDFEVLSDLPVLLASLLVLVAIPAVAFGAAKPGTYKGTSSGKYIQIGQAEEPTDRGKVSFTVKSSKVLELQDAEASWFNAARRQRSR